MPPRELEGQTVFDKDERRVGVLESLNVLGTHIASFRVKLDKGGVVEVPRDWYMDSLPDGVQLRRTSAEIRRLGKA